MLNIEKFHIPKDPVESYDGNTLHFRISEEDAKSRFMEEYPPPPSTKNEGLAAARKAEKTMGDSKETTVPITEERLDVSKRESATEATITKKPVTETKTVEVPVTHEEMSVERRPASGMDTGDRPVESEEEVRVPLKSEEVQVTKKPYVKEEVSVKKKPITETKTVTDKVTSEKVKVKGAGGQAKEIE